jgi:hypothetical protein
MIYMRKYIYDPIEWALGKNQSSQIQNFAKIWLMTYKIYEYEEIHCDICKACFVMDRYGWRRNWQITFSKSLPSRILKKKNLFKDLSANTWPQIDMNSTYAVRLLSTEWAIIQFIYVRVYYYLFIYFSIPYFFTFFCLFTPIAQKLTSQRRIWWIWAVNGFITGLFLKHVVQERLDGCD